jgi:hypothetical protein
MLHFIYTYSEHKRRNDYTLKTVRIYRIKKNVPELVAEASDTFVSEFQLFMETAETYRLLPEKAFERSEHHGGVILGTAYALENAGIAKVTRID